MSKNATTAAGWDEEYEAGRWAFLRSLPESGRYGIIGMWLSLTGSMDDVLDIGCGEGLLYERLQPMGVKRYVGMDLSPASLQIANVDPAIASLRAGDMHTFEAQEAKRSPPLSSTRFFTSRMTRLPSLPATSRS